MRELLDTVDQEDVSLPQYRIMEAVYACLETLYYLGLTSGVGVMSVDDLMKKVQGSKSSSDAAAEDVELPKVKSGQYL